MTQEAITRLPVGDIAVGPRLRRDPGNVHGLATSIERVGLLHPVVVNRRHELVAGFRRLQAVKKLGWATVPCRVVESLDDAATALKAELYENTDREPLTPTEVAERGRQLEELERPRAAAREKAGKKSSDEPCGNFPQGQAGKTRDKVGEALGVSGRTYDKIKQVVDAAEADPERFGDLPAKMDAESVDSAHRELKDRKQATPTATGVEGRETRGDHGGDRTASPAPEDATHPTGAGRKPSPPYRWWPGLAGEAESVIRAGRDLKRLAKVRVADRSPDAVAAVIRELRRRADALDRLADGGAS